jgi:hypothetical protein
MMGFIVAMVGFLGVLGVLLWFTGWAENEIVEPEQVEAKTP